MSNSRPVTGETHTHRHTYTHTHSQHCDFKSGYGNDPGGARTQKALPSAYSEHYSTLQTQQGHSLGEGGSTWPTQIHHQLCVLMSVCVRACVRGSLCLCVCARVSVCVCACVCART